LKKSRIKGLKCDTVICEIAEISEMDKTKDYRTENKLIKDDGKNIFF